MADDPVISVDGTYEPTPPPILADPLAGLVTGAHLPVQRRDEILPTAPPGLPDAAEIRQEVEATLDRQPAPGPAPQYQPPPPLPAPRLRDLVRKLPTTVRRPKDAHTGAGVVIVIVLVTIVLFYAVVSSLADTFGKLF